MASASDTGHAAESASGLGAESASGLGAESASRLAAGSACQFVQCSRRGIWDSPKEGAAMRFNAQAAEYTECVPAARFGCFALLPRHGMPPRAAALHET